jgi:hypothetical protein
MNYPKLIETIGAISNSTTMTDAELTAALNASTEKEAYMRFCSVRTLMAELGMEETASILAAIETAAQTNAGIKLALDMLKVYADGGGLDLGHANTRTVLDSLVQAGVLTAEQNTNLKAIAERAVSPAQKAGLSVIDIEHVRSARKLMEVN